MAARAVPSSVCQMRTASLPDTTVMTSLAYAFCPMRIPLRHNRLVMSARHIRSHLQAPPELLDWMNDFGFKQSTVEAVAGFAFEVMPTLANAQANVKALQRDLLMTDRQVRLLSSLQCSRAHA